MWKIHLLYRFFVSNVHSSSGHYSDYFKKECLWFSRNLIYCDRLSTVATMPRLDVPNAKSGCRSHPSVYISRHTINGISFECFENPVLIYIYIYIYIYTHTHTGLFISPYGISELDCATTKTDTAERSISIRRESLQDFCTRVLGVLPGSTARG